MSCCVRATERVRWGARTAAWQLQEAFLSHLSGRLTRPRCGGGVPRHFRSERRRKYAKGNVPALFSILFCRIRHRTGYLSLYLSLLFTHLVPLLTKTGCYLVLHLTSYSRGPERGEICVRGDPALRIILRDAERYFRKAHRKNSETPAASTAPCPWTGVVERMGL